VSLEDAKKVALDFVFTRTTRSSLRALLEQYDFSALNAARPAAYEWLAAGRDVLLVRAGSRELRALDSAGRDWFRIEPCDQARCLEVGGVEYVEGLVLVLDGLKLPLPPRWGG
jgi:hypothetical protein